jgi:hypothetical protein
MACTHAWKDKELLQFIANVGDVIIAGAYQMCCAAM